VKAVAPLSGGLQILDLHDMHDGAAGEIFSETIGVKIHAHFHGVPSHHSHIVIGDIVARAIRETKPKPSEGLSPEQLADLFWFNHGRMRVV
jgi:hypothetical protein